jgi:hypothetical protein
MKKSEVIPGQVCVVKDGHTLTMDGHLTLYGVSWEMKDGGQFIIVSFPRKITKINLVRVQINPEEECECFYTDVLKHAEVDPETRINSFQKKKAL